MSKDDFENTAQDPLAPTDTNQQPSVPTKAQLLATIKRQEQLLQTPGLKNDPPWLQDPDDPVRKELRTISRTRARLTKRLDRARQKFEQDFDLSS